METRLVNSGDLSGSVVSGCGYEHKARKLPPHYSTWWSWQPFDHCSWDKCSLVCCPSLQIIQTNIKQDYNSKNVLFMLLKQFLHRQWWMKTLKEMWASSKLKWRGSKNSWPSFLQGRYQQKAFCPEVRWAQCSFSWGRVDISVRTLRRQATQTSPQVFVFISPTREHGTWSVTRYRFCRHWILWDVWEGGVEIILNSSFLLIPKKTY